MTAIDFSRVASDMADALLASLKDDGATLKALATGEANKLAQSLATVAGLLASGAIDAEEAGVLVQIQRSASETVLASLQGISAVAARRATDAALGSVVSGVDAAIGAPVVGTLLALGQAAGLATP